MMTKPKIGVVIPQPLRDSLFSSETLTRLQAMGDLVMTDATTNLTLDEAAALLQGCTVGVGSWRTVAPSADLLPRCPDLKLWVHAAGSVKGMFGPHLDGRDLTIASCAPAIADAVAEIVIGELIVGLKRVLENGAANRSGRAAKPANSRALSSSTVGVVGASQVGRRVINHLRHFGARILLYDPFVTDADARAMGAERHTDLTALCAASHAVTLHTPYLPATHHLLGAAPLAALPDDAVLVNASRGGCVDEAALIAELTKGRLFAFLDVTDPEPAADDSPLRRLPNVVLTSHIAGGPENKIGKQVADDIKAWTEGRPLAMAVTADMLDRLA